jgi:hypothetical protein
MNQKVLHKVFIWGFLFLYLLVALISFCHAVQFFNIGNVQWMSVSLAFAFELGLALSLASILLSEQNKKQTLPWILMCVLTLVQVCGNVYSVFKYISESDIVNYQYLAKPLLFFIQEVDDETIQIIISWIMGAILPVVALMMTDMVATNIKMGDVTDEEAIEEINTSDVKKDKSPIVKEPIRETPVTTEIKDVKVDKIPEAPFKVELPESEEFKDANISNEEDFTDGSVKIPTPEVKETEKSSIRDKFKGIIKPILLPNKQKKDTYHASENYFKSPEVKK